MVIGQGDLYWIEVRPPIGSEPGYTRPYLVVQNNVFNQSLIQTVLVCSLTTNPRLADAPGNVMLPAGEAGLPRQSVVNISQIMTVNKSDLGEYIGTLSSARLFDVLDGIHGVIDPREPPR